MERLTTDNPHGNIETARNLFYIKDRETWVRGGGPEPDYKDVSLYDFVRWITELHGLDIITTDNEAMGEHLCDLLMDNMDTIEGVVALLYTAAWAFSELRERLTAYEDTGLEPEEIISGEELAEIASTLLQLLQYQALGTVEELSALVKARDEGQVVVLPCKVGGIVYYVLPDCNEYLGYFVSEPHRVTEVGTKGFWTSAIPDDEPDAMSDFTPWSDLGKTVFLTRAEAEAALQEGGHHETDPV